METENLISIVMPVYNSKRFVSMAIESILRQKMYRYQLILVDDGSTDGSSDICDEYAREHQQIMVIHKKNGGICDARNYGLNLVQAKYVYFMDNDDVLEDDFFQSLSYILEENSYDIIMFGTNLTDIVDGCVKSKRKRSLSEFQALSSDEFKKHIPDILEAGMHLCVWDKLYRTEFLIQNNACFDTVFTHGGEDLCFNVSLFPFVKSALNIDKAFYNYYIRDDQSTYRKFNPNVYKHALINIDNISRMLNQMEIEDVDYLYRKYIEYRQRLVLMLLHRNSEMTFSQKSKLCKKEYSEDGYSLKFKARALMVYLKTENISFRKKFSACLNILGLYKVQLRIYKKYMR